MIDTAFDIIKRYGEIARDFHVEFPIFPITHEFAMILFDPNENEFQSDRYIPWVKLPKNKKNIPGAIGEYCGVLLVRVEIGVANEH